MKTTKINLKLIILLEERNINDTTLAKMTGLNRVTVYRLKKGKSVPEYPTLVKIAEALGVEVKEII